MFLIGGLDVKDTGPEDLLGARIRQARGVKGWTIGELADRADVPKSTLYRYEKGLSLPPAAEARRICDALNISLDYLIRGVDSFENAKSPSVALLDVDDDAVRVMRLSVALHQLTREEQIAVSRLVASILESRMGWRGFEVLIREAEREVSAAADAFISAVGGDEQAAALGEKIAAALDVESQPDSGADSRDSSGTVSGDSTG